MTLSLKMKRVTTHDLTKEMYYHEDVREALRDFRTKRKERTGWKDENDIVLKDMYEIFGDKLIGEAVDKAKRNG